MTNYFTIYDSDGRILLSGNGPQESAYLIPEGGGMVWGVSGDHSTEYVLDGEITQRPLFDVAIDGLTIMGVPSNTSVYIDGELLGQCDTGVVSFEKENQLDTVSVRLSLFPYIDKEITL